VCSASSASIITLVEYIDKQYLERKRDEQSIQQEKRCLINILQHTDLFQVAEIPTYSLPDQGLAVSSSYQYLEATAAIIDRHGLSQVHSSAH
jgi:hypothetical protein